MLRWLAAALFVFGAACGEDAAEPTAEPSSVQETHSDMFGTGTVILPGDDGSVLIDVEVADTPEARAQGLMFRESLPEDAGMLFVFFEDNFGGFYMKNTKIPLSIAYFDEDGKILRIMDMDPCERDPCKTYDPGVIYRGALEVNQGMFEEWGVEEGEVLEIAR